MKNSGDGKVKALLELVEITARLKSQGRCVVYCHGVFDLVHPGQIQWLEAAKRQGDVLLVTVTPDEYAGREAGRPVFDQRLRAESVAALQCVDYVAINQGPTAAEVIHLLRPDVFVRQREHDQQEGASSGRSLAQEEQEAVLSVGGRIHLIDHAFSSSDLIDKFLNIVPPETEDWLSAFREGHSLEEVVGYLDGAAKLKALVVGEAIIDEYVFCDGLGKSSKDPILAFQHRWTETYAGGSLAVANHLAGFCDQVGIVAVLGDAERREDVVRRALLPNVRPHLLTRRGTPTIHKRRFVDTHTSARMFELYVLEDTPIGAADEAALAQELAGIMGQYDLVVVADYGHGMLTAPSISALCTGARFLAVNTQANAGNRGFNTISKYPRADYVCLAGHEVALETRMRHACWRDLVMEVTKRIDCQRFTVTQGKNGSLHYQPGYGFTEVPALAVRIADRVGAGDAVLAVTSLLVAQEAPWDVVGFVGNVAGAQMVAELGNRVAVSRDSTARHIMSLMKQLGARNP